MTIDPASLMTEGQPTQQQDPNGIQSLRDAAERGRAAVAENTQLKRENAFLKAGVNPESSKNHEWFVKGYDGDLTTDAITAAAREAGLLAAPPEPQADHAVQAAQQGQAAVSQASSGTEPASDNSGKLYALEQAIGEGGVDAMMKVGQSLGLPIARPS